MGRECSTHGSKQEIIQAFGVIEEGKRQFRIQRRLCDDKIKMDFGEMG
jgi:hypothetical protein